MDRMNKGNDTLADSESVLGAPDYEPEVPVLQFELPVEPELPVLILELPVVPVDIFELSVSPALETELPVLPVYETELPVHLSESNTFQIKVEEVENELEDEKIILSVLLADQFDSNQAKMHSEEESIIERVGISRPLNGPVEGIVNNKYIVLNSLTESMLWMDC
jgi:hypothetical protein